MLRSSIIRELGFRTDGAAGAEFALVLPLLILFLFGLVDVGRYMWTLNQLEKATQVGVRRAVVTNMVASDLGAKDFGSVLGQGAVIPNSSFGQMHCDKSSGSLTCACDSNCTGIGTTADATAFASMVTRMAQIAPELKDTEVKITYTNSGLGYAGDPNGSDVSPIVTVSTRGNVPFAPLVLFGGSFNLPIQSASMTLEDASGTTSN